MEEIKTGRYRHFKGGEYEVLYLARHSETEEQMVVYRMLYGDRSIWVRPASMWNETVERDGKSFKRFTYIGDSHFLLRIRSFLQQNNVETDNSADRYVSERKAGRKWSFSEHIQALVYAQLSNQTKWSRIVPRLDEIDAMFFHYDAEKIKALPGNYFSEKLFELKCGNISTQKQMAALADNIRVLEKIEKDFGSLDAFVSGEEALRVVKKLSDADSEYKLAMMGEALAWEYIRNVGIDGAKPDTHIRRFLSAERMGCSAGKTATTEEALSQIEIISGETGLSKAAVDSIIWHFCADGFGEICTAQPHCQRCPIRSECKKGKQ